MSEHQNSIDVQVPLRTAYNQWTQFETFPLFMDGVESVEQLDDTHLHWVATIAGTRREWNARITEQIPDQRIAWASTSGARNGGVVTFHPVDADTTRIQLDLDFEAEGLLENVGDKLGFVSARIAGDLRRFKDFIESAGVETGAWRGRVD